MNTLSKSIQKYLDEIGNISLFAFRFFRQVFRRPFEFKELLRQCYMVGYNSLFLVIATGFIMGVVGEAHK